MDRIKFLNNKYLVLCIPELYNSSGNMELLLGSWNDPYFSNIYVKECNNIKSAKKLAEKRPIINWNRIISIFYDHHMQTGQFLKNIISDNMLKIMYISSLMTPEELKSIFFSRVYQKGKDFLLYQDMCDVSQHTLYCHPSVNIEDFAIFLISIEELRIFSYEILNNLILIHGYTDNGLSYTIKIINPN